jgi:O-antigen ligase
LRAILLLSLAGFLFSFVLLGHIESTLLPMYALAMFAVGVYVLARGLHNTVISFSDYLGSRTMAPRWAFLALAAFSLLWTFRPGGGEGGSSLTRVLTLFLIHTSAWVVYDATRRLGEFNNILRIIFYSTALGATLALLDLSANESFRIQGLYGNPNVLAMTGVLAVLAFIVYLSAFVARWEKILGVILVVLLHVAVLASGSRKGLVGLVFVWLLGLGLRRTRKLTVVTVGMVLMTALAGFAAAPKQLQDAALRNVYRLGVIFLQSSSSATVDFSYAERSRFIEKGIALMAESPVFGSGLDTFRTLSGEGAYAHNNYVELGVAVGLVGILVFYAFHLGLLYGLAKLQRRARGCLRSDATFGLAALALILVMDVAAVTYMSKLLSILPILLAGKLDALHASDRPGWRAW